MEDVRRSLLLQADGKWYDFTERWAAVMAVSLPVCLSVTSHYSKLICWKTVQHTSICQNGNTGHLWSWRWAEGYLGSCCCVILSPFLFPLCLGTPSTTSPLLWQQRTQSMLSGLALPALMLRAPLLSALFPLLPREMVSGIWREKGRGAVFKANHKPEENGVE